MKKIFAMFFALAVAGGMQMAAQEGVSSQREELDRAELEQYRRRMAIPKRHYINLSRSWQHMKFASSNSEFAPDLRSTEGVALEAGSTFFFNGMRPIAGMVRIGLDFSYLDAQYNRFGITGIGVNGGSVKLAAHYANLGMRLGPSVTVTPVRNINVRGYVHVTPSMSAVIYDEFSLDNFEELKGGFSLGVAGGVQASWRFLTLGLELRDARAKLASVDPDKITLDDSGDSGGEFDGVEDLDDVEMNDAVGPKQKVKLPGVRLIFGFRF
jgi:hypothetical protein